MTELTDDDLMPVSDMNMTLTPLDSTATFKPVAQTVSVSLMDNTNKPAVTVGSCFSALAVIVVMLAAAPNLFGRELVRDDLSGVLMAVSVGVAKNKNHDAARVHAAKSSSATKCDTEDNRGVQHTLSTAKLAEIVGAIYRIEGGSKTRYPYGIKSINTNGDVAKAKRICENTVINNWKRWQKVVAKGDYLDYLCNVYCPPSADPQGNRNWKKNIHALVK